MTWLNLLRFADRLPSFARTGAAALASRLAEPQSFTPAGASAAAFSGGPVFREIARAMTRRLAVGEWKPGAAIPSETRLKEEFGVAIGTIRRAVDELVAQNMLVRQQGRGTFVATHNRDRLLFHFFHIERRDGYKEYPDVRLHDFESVRLVREVAALLGMHEGDRAVRFRNTLSLEGQKIMLDEITVPESLFPRLTEKKLRERNSTLYNLYQDEYRITVVRTSQRLGGGLVPREVARALEVPVGLPVLVIRRIAFAYHDRPVEYRVSYVDTRLHDYVGDTHR